MARPRKNAEMDDIPTADTIPEDVLREAMDKVETEQVDEIIAEPPTVEPEDDGPVKLNPLTQEEMEKYMIERDDDINVMPRAREPRPVKPVPQSIRDTGLSSDQRDVLLRKGLKDILDKAVVDNRIPTLVKYFRDADGLSTLYAYYDIDIRAFRRAYEFFCANADNPTSEAFLNVLTEVHGKPKRVIPKLSMLDITNKVPRRR